MRARKNLAVATLLAICMGILATTAIAEEESGTALRATLRGFSEAPSIASTASGEFQGTISEDGSSITFVLSYEGFLPGRNVLFAHIHVAQRGVNGAVIVFFCGGGGRPPCTAPSGTFTGTIDATSVISEVVAQDITGTPAERLAKLISAIRGGVAYVNVHTSTPDPQTGHPGGEIRGQIRVVGDDGESHDDHHDDHHHHEGHGH